VRIAHLDDTFAWYFHIRVPALQRLTCKGLNSCVVELSPVVIDSEKRERKETGTI